MGYQIPTRSTPAGCVLAFFGLFFYALAGIGLYGLWLLQRTDQLPEGSDPFWLLMFVTLLGITLGTIMVYVGYRLFRKIDHTHYDPNDPDEPMMKV